MKKLAQKIMPQMKYQQRPNFLISGVVVMKLG